MPRLVLIGIALALGIGLVYLIFVRELPRTEEQGQAIAQQTLDMSQVVMKQQRGDQVEWIVTAERATYNETLRLAQLTPVRFQVLRSGGTNPRPVDLQGTADTALLDQDGQQVILRGRAHLTEGNALELKSDELQYLHDAGVIRATGHVEIRRESELVNSEAAEYSIRTEKITLKAPRLFQ